MDALFWLLLSIPMLVMGGLVLSASIVHWRAAVLIVGIILINIFTFWASVGVFVACCLTQLWEHVQKKTLTAQVFLSVLLGSATLTFFAVSAAWVVGIIFQFVGGGAGGSGACTRGTPWGC